MAIVVVQVGQCGNQLGDELFSQLALIAADEPRRGTVFFARDGKARCVLVDSEPKVVHGVRGRHPELIRAENVISGQSGRGNNWGLGYYGVNSPHSARHAPDAAAQRAFHNLGKDQRVEDNQVLTRALRALHLETRRTTDAGAFEAIVLLHSLVGGTGSGLASRLAEKVRFYFVARRADEADVDELAEDAMRRRDGLDGMLVDSYRARHLVSVAVAPLAAGEMATQGINAALTLHCLLPHVDALVLLRNDDTLGAGLGTHGPPTTARSLDGFAQPRRCVTFKEANEVLVGLLLPLLHFGQSPRDDEPGCVDSLVAQCVPRDQAGLCKLLTLVPTPQRSYAAFARSAVRCRLYALHGTGKTMLPGCSATVPVTALLRPAALAQYQASLAPPPSPVAPRSSANATSSSHPTPDETTTDAVYTMVTLKVPSALRAHYQTLRRAPVAAMYANLEGVLVLNQVHELNACVLFPLLRSAALKVRLGAFTAPYVDVGLTTEYLVDAARAVAEVLSRAEEV